MPFAVLILPAILLVGCCLAWIIGEGPARSEWTAAMAELENEGPNDEAVLLRLRQDGCGADAGDQAAS